ncbi:hypothetical protein LNN31_13710 [Acetobacterium wieringae]|uniref:Uncharacterized protein n=1 Tax=Acetobacterium wieringae TaxID=52694 RepID=A0ABY6HDZ4_9FIRM|nr:hypothetical protein [Acetobacterium wieringae]UYO61831.1 hypothetical protein LNN31_13710 [Acetobacterium wieringae]
MNDKLIQKHCHTCGDQLNTWDARISKSLGYTNPLCENCVAKEYDKTVEELREVFESFFDMRPCMGI